MKISTFIILTCIFIITSFVFAQADELYLKDGSIIEGNVIEVKDNMSYRILTKDGSDFVYPIDNVKDLKFSDVTQTEEPILDEEKLAEQQEIKLEMQNGEAHRDMKKMESEEVVLPSGEVVRQGSKQTIPTQPYTSNKKDHKDKIDFEMSMSIIYSSKYSDLLDDAFPKPFYDREGGGKAWLGFDLGIRYNVTDQLSISPTIGILFNWITVNDSYSYYSEYNYLDNSLGSVSWNTIILPKIAARYQFVKGSSPYVGLELNFNKPHTQSDMLEFESGGLGYAVFLGYAPLGKGIIELGYQYIPIEVPEYINIPGYYIPLQLQEITYGDRDKKDNFGGGIMLRFGWSF